MEDHKNKQQEYYSQQDKTIFWIFAFMAFLMALVLIFLYIQNTKPNQLPNIQPQAPVINQRNTTNTNNAVNPTQTPTGSPSAAPVIKITQPSGLRGY